MIDSPITPSDEAQARKAFLELFEATTGSWDREFLLDRIADDHDRETAEDALAALEAAGEVYTVNGEVTRT